MILEQEEQKVQVRRFRQNMLFRLMNDNNANNCFVNVVVQNFWHLNGFQHALKQIILEFPRLKKEDGIVYYFAKLLKEIKESHEGAVHSVAALKEAILTEMLGANNFEWNEQADVAEAFLLLLNKIHEYFAKRQLENCCLLHSACQLTLRKKTICRWPNCQGINNEEMDTDVYQ